MIYLDNAATSKFKPQCMFDAMMRECIDSANPGRSGHDDSIAAGMNVFNARNSVKKFLNADDDYEIVFTSNCTDALNTAIMGFLAKYAYKVHVITSIFEHNSTLRTLFYLQNKGKIDLTYVKPDKNFKISISDIESVIRANTVLVCLNHMSNVIGTHIDVEEIALKLQSKHIPLLLDCAQSLGHISLDLKQAPISMIAAAGHKGLHGPQGTGFLLVHRSVKLSPIKFGGTGTHSDSLFQPYVIPEGFEVGTLNTCGVVALASSVEWTGNHLDDIRRLCDSLAGELMYGLKQIPNVRIYSPAPSPVISFNIDTMTSTNVGDILNDNDIAVRSGLHCAPLIHKFMGTLESGTVRASIGYNNRLQDVTALLKCVEEIAASC